MWKEDLFRYEGVKNQNLLVRLKYRFCVPGFVYIYFFRKTQGATNALCRTFYAIFLKLTSYITGIQIPPQAQIGRGFYIGHWGTIIVNPAVKIGKNFTIAPGAVIGNSKGKRGGIPVLGDNVYMCANSVIVGGVKIGNDVFFAPGAFCNFDVPDNSIVLGNPGQIHRRNSSPTAPFIVYPCTA